jgi:hypothetical protein
MFRRTVHAAENLAILAALLGASVALRLSASRARRRVLGDWHGQAAHA